MSRVLLSAAALFVAAGCLVIATGPLRAQIGPVRLSLSGAPLLFAEAAVAFLLWVVWFASGTDRRAVALGVGGSVLLALALAADSRPRRIGDGAEYLAMALHVRGAPPPPLTRAEVAALDARVSALAGFDPARIESMTVETADGRRVFVHFWLYPLLASPFVRAADALAAHPNHGFTALNLVAVAIASWALARQAGIRAVLVLLAPLLWWVDKAHAELFIVACLAAGLTWLPRAPAAGLIAISAAVAQNPGLAPLWLGAAALVLWSCRGRAPRVWGAVVAGAAICLVHPVYCRLTLDRWSSLQGTLLPHVPGIVELLTPLVDPNLGVLVHLPILTAALALACVVGRGRWNGVASLGLAAAVVTLAIATQTPNVNHGGTFDPSRYGIWLVPLLGSIVWTLPPLRPVAATALAVLASLSLVSSAVLTRPDRGENYLSHSPLAEALLGRWPAIYSPLPELFVERTIGLEDDTRLPVAFGACSKVLLAGAGDGAVAWPVPCEPAPVPERCRPAGALCFATRTDGGYAFSAAPRQPAFVPAASPYAWTSAGDLGWLGLPPGTWSGLRAVRAGREDSWVRRGRDVHYVHTVQGDRQLVAWIDRLDSGSPSITLQLPRSGHACLFDPVARARIACQDIAGGAEVPLDLPPAPRTLLVIDTTTTVQPARSIG